MVIIWTKPAKLDLKLIHDYIAVDSRFYARKVSQEITDRSEELSSFPEAGRIVPEVRVPAIRELIIYSYRLIYEVLPDRIEILAVIHGKRNFTSGVLKREG